MRHLIVPVDGSDTSWRGFDVALRLAERVGSTVRVVEVACDPVDRRFAEDRIARELDRRGPFVVEVTPEVRLAAGAVAAELVDLVTIHSDATVVMSSHGRGRSAAIVGSVADDVLRRAFGPVVLVGPNARPTDFSGPVLVTVDGSPESERAVPLATAWAAMLRSTPWVVNVSSPTIVAADRSGDTLETAYPARLAQHAACVSGRAVEFDELHGRRPGPAVTEYARHHRASMIVASSHGRSGLSRLIMGSVVAEFVGDATCPVTVIRLPHPDAETSGELMWRF